MDSTSFQYRTGVYWTSRQHNIKGMIIKYNVVHKIRIIGFASKKFINTIYNIIQKKYPLEGTLDKEKVSPSIHKSHYHVIFALVHSQVQWNPQRV